MLSQMCVGFTWNVSPSPPISTKIETYQQILVKMPSTNFWRKNPSDGRSLVVSVGDTDTRGEANGRFSQCLCCLTSECHVNVLNMLVVTKWYGIFIVKFINARLDKIFPDFMILEYRSFCSHKLAIRCHPFCTFTCRTRNSYRIAYCYLLSTCDLWLDISAGNFASVRLWPWFRQITLQLTHLV